MLCQLVTGLDVFRSENEKYPVVLRLDPDTTGYPHILAYPDGKVNSYTTIFTGVKYKIPL